MEHEHTQHVAAPPDRVFAALADVNNLPRYVPQLTAAQRGEAWFRTDEDAHRIEWGSPGSDYHGWIQVSPDGDGSRLTLFLATVHGDAPDSEVMGTLDAMRRLVEAGK
jgi:uncharacterized protein YndB with AHSA1/START domain